jgi:hypothetical protein
MRDCTKVVSIPQQLDQHLSGELLKMVLLGSVVMEIEWERDNRSKSLQRPKSSEKLNEKRMSRSKTQYRQTRQILL